MVVAEIPEKLGPDFLIKTIFPGIIVFIAFFQPIYPFIYEFWDPLNFGDKLLICILFGTFTGLIFILCDLHIYQILEGVWFWPSPLRRWKYEKIQRFFIALDKDLGRLIKQKREQLPELSATELEELSLRIINLSEKAREFPPNNNKNNFTKRYPVRPTRFGNVLCEYEDYSLNRYGIHMMVFWNHLSQLIGKEIKDELKFKGAIADMCVYLCFTALLATILGPVILFFQKESWIVVLNFSIPAKSILYLSFSLSAFKILYELSITQHKNYGRFVKSIFDLYRGELAKALGIEIKRMHHASKEELEEEKALWKEYLHYYLDYKFIKRKHE